MHQPCLFLEDLLPKLGWGLYHKFLLGTACAHSFVAAAAALSLPFAVALSTCETPASRGVLYAIPLSHLAGKCLGGFTMCSLSDVIGRKRVLTYSSLTVFLALFTAAFAYNHYMVMLAAFLLGGGLESNACVVRVHLAEILPKRARGFYLVACDVCWTLGYLSVALLALLAKRATLQESRAVDLKLATWRLLLALSGGSSLVLACCTALLEESPRFLLHAKKEYLAVLALRQFYAINESGYGNALELKELGRYVEDYGLAPHTPAAKLVLKATGLTLRSPFAGATLLVASIKLPLALFSLLHVNTLLAKFLTAPQPSSGLGVVYLDYAGGPTMCPGFGAHKTLYGNFFVLAVNVLLGQALTMWFIDRLGRRACLVAPLAVGGGAMLALDFVEDNMTRMVACSVVILGVAAAASTVSVVGIESFPTAVRGTAHGVANFWGLVAAIFFVRFFDAFASWAFFVGGGGFVAASLVANCVRDLKKQPMVE